MASDAIRCAVPCYSRLLTFPRASAPHHTPGPQRVVPRPSQATKQPSASSDPPRTAAGFLAHAFWRALPVHVTWSCHPLPIACRSLPVSPAVYHPSSTARHPFSDTCRLLRTPAASCLRRVRLGAWGWFVNSVRLELMKDGWMEAWGSSDITLDAVQAGVGMAVDMRIGEGAEVFLGNGVHMLCLSPFSYRSHL
ncbi:hypothetical protein GGX14DRAFT_666842 [Mycena pura]|uniref:Uncharacterized protein n=1 Tax=Mycena pura TaxID=153505 RepID=A0AAD6V2L9_9AGAR|nr:hypothetical protein GGX14DRAFT_666842 [Mycena pura]